jgi:hypothetical protein
MNNNIIWKSLPIDEFKDIYEISNTGIIKNSKTKIIKKYQDGSTGYKMCNFTDGKISKRLQVHNLVANAFVESVPEKEGFKIIVKFKDNDKSNLNSNNLQFAYQKSKIIIVDNPIVNSPVVNNPIDDIEYTFGNFTGKKIKVNPEFLISKQGTIYSLKNHEIKKINNNPYGYSRICLPTAENPNKKFYVHRLVAEAYIPNLNNYAQVNHIDLNKHNNNVDNLEWCSESMNMKHNAQNKPQFSRKVQQFDTSNILLNTFASVKEASDYSKLDSTSIIHCCAGRRKTGGGFVWKYVV